MSASTHKVGFFTLEQCNNCFWQGVPNCPRKEWSENVIQRCEFMLKTMSDEEEFSGFNAD